MKRLLLILLGFNLCCCALPLYCQDEEETNEEVDEIDVEENQEIGHDEHALEDTGMPIGNEGAVPLDNQPSPSGGGDTRDLHTDTFFADLEESVGSNPETQEEPVGAEGGEEALGAGEGEIEGSGEIEGEGTSEIEGESAGESESSNEVESTDNANGEGLTSQNDDWLNSDDILIDEEIAMED